jgi:hypothetical protein
VPLNGIPVPVDNPPKREPATSLLQVARAIGTVVTETDERFGQGIASDPDPCGTGGIFDPCLPADVDAWACADGTGSDEDQPFALRVGVTRTTLDQNVDLRDRARRALAICEHGLIGSEFWTGALADASGWPNVWLASPAATIVGYDAGPGPVNVLDSLAILEDHAVRCDCGARSMIHASPRLVTLWEGAGILRRESGLNLTALDSIVVTGPGYDGSSPTGDPQTDTSSWAYATGLVEIRLGPVADFTGFDEETNDVVSFAQRLAVARFAPCCHLAIEVDLSDKC